MLIENTGLDTTKFFPEVLQAVPTDDFKVYAYMNDGSIHLYDAKPMIEKKGVFTPLADIKIFKEKITVVGYTVAWDLEGNRDEYKCIDIDPFIIFNSPKVEDPLE